MPGARRRTRHLGDGQVNHRPVILAQLQILRVLDHADDLVQRLRVEGSGFDPESAAHWVFAFHHLVRECLVDDGDPGGAGRVALVEIAARKEGRLNGAKVAWADVGGGNQPS